MLHPPIKPFNQFYLPVTDGHILYVEEIGNPNGIPIVFLHGGPGSGLDEDHRRFFDPDKFYVILFDQRGCGKSQPYASIENNTTNNLIEDIRAIKDHLRITKWHVFGGSWGSFLALAYAERYPDHIQSLILRGLFLGRREEIEFFYQHGASMIYPEEFEEFISILSLSEQKSIVESYYKRLIDPNFATVQEAAKHWSFWEASCLKLLNTKQSIHQFAKKERLLSLARIEAHYFKHGCFIEDDQLLLEAYKIQQIPITLVHGRYDLVCPIKNAFLLKKQLPHLELKIAPSSGHAATEVEILNFLNGALDKLR